MFRNYFDYGWFFGMATLAFGLASQAKAKNHSCSTGKSNNFTMVCPPVGGDNPRGLTHCKMFRAKVGVLWQGRFNQSKSMLIDLYVGYAGSYKRSVS